MADKPGSIHFSDILINVSEAHYSKFIQFPKLICSLQNIPINNGFPFNRESSHSCNCMRWADYKHKLHKYFK